MDGSCYVPNNPQYGLQLECQWNTPQNGHPVHCNGIIQLPSICTSAEDPTDLEQLSPIGVGSINVSSIDIPHHHHHHQHDNQSIEHHQQPPAEAQSPSASSACWTTADPGGGGSLPGDDMGSFSMPLDLDPLPTLFPFSPCTATVYKTESNCSPTLQSHPKEKPVHDMADVLLSLKHAVVHPGQAAEAAYHHHQQQQQPQQQLSYTVHPHQFSNDFQMLMSPNGYYCEQLPPPSYPTNHHQTNGMGGQLSTGPPIFPSMSVNVSMNMTYHPTTMSGYEQMQWGNAPQASSPGYIQNQSGLLSPTYTGGATYSFTADFRPPNVQDVPLITTSSSFKPVLNAKAQFSPVRSPKKMGFVSPGKLQMVCGDDESQRPNLCRICGKTYARPSTLKTHLRTHSGEKPYRCVDCNKSFSQAANLTAHVRTHSGEKPFRCPICDRRFSQSSSVTTHMRTHSGERPYRCRMCKKAFSDSSTLTKHLRIHSGEKPYQCKLCLLRFSQSGNLNRHMRVHGTNNMTLV